LWLALVALVVAVLAPGRPFGQREAHAEAEVRPPHGSAGRPALQLAASDYTLTCFVHNHLDADGNVISSHIGVYTLNWRVSDGSEINYQLSGCGVMTLAVTGAAAGAEGFDTFNCVMSHELLCGFNIPVVGGGSVSGITGQPTLNVPAGQTAVLNITSELVFVSAD
jgi:hypothetical protein